MVTQSNSPVSVLSPLAQSFKNGLGLALRHCTRGAVGCAVVLIGFIVLATDAKAQFELDEALLFVEKAGTANSTGSAEIVAQDDVIDWVVKLRLVQPAQNNVTLTDTFIGDHAYVPGSLTHSGEFDFNESTLTSATTELQGTATQISRTSISTIETLEKSLDVSSFQFPVGSGDGWKVVFHPSTDRIFYTAHHWNEFSTSCFSSQTGEACPTYPKSFTSEGLHVPTTANNRGYEIFGDHYYFVGRQLGGDRYGVSCWNIVTENECGFTAFGNVTDAPAIPHDDPLIGFGKVSNTQWWSVDNRLTAHCFNPTTNSACTGEPSIDFADGVNVVANQQPHASAIVGAGPITRTGVRAFMDFELLDQKLYLALNYRSVSQNAAGLKGIYGLCLDLNTGGLCAGFSDAQLTHTSSSNYPFIHFDRDVIGAPTAFCVSASPLRNARCLPLDGSGTVVDFSSVANGVGAEFRGNLINPDDFIPGDEFYDAVENQTYFAPFFKNTNLPNVSGVVCFDWSTRDACANWGYDPTGDTGIAIASNDPNAGTEDYAITEDPVTGCLFALGNTNLAYTFDRETGTSPCRTESVTVLRRGQYVDSFCSTGLDGFAGEWLDFTLEGLDLGDFTSLTVSFFSDALLQNQIGQHDYTASGDVGAPDPLSLSFVDPNTVDALYYQIEATLVAGAENPFVDPAPQSVVRYSSNKPAEICYQTQPQSGGCGFKEIQLENLVQVSADGLGTVSKPGNTLRGQIAGLCPAPTSVGDEVYLDTDFDGTRAVGEGLLAGAEVRLFDNTDGDGVFDGDDYSETLVTQADTPYAFDGIFPGDYCITSALEGNVLPTTPTDAPGDPLCFTVNTDEDFLAADIGYGPFPSVGNQVYEDLNNNGSHDANEAGLSDVLVTLYENSDGDGVRSAAETVGTRVTDGLGGYEFTEIEPGDYCVTADGPAGFELSVGAGGQSSPYCFTLVLGQSEDDADFGFYAPITGLGAPFTCDGSIYQVARFSDANGDFTEPSVVFSLEVENGIYVYSEFAEAPFNDVFNALAFNVNDGFLYATSNGAPSNPSNIGELFRIGADGTFVNLGAPVSAADPSVIWDSGGSNVATADGDGNYYILTPSTANGGNFVLLRLDLEPASRGGPVTFETLQTYSFNTQDFHDFSFDPVTQNLFSVGFESRRLLSIDLNDPTYTIVSQTMTGDRIGASSGATWFNALGELFVFSNEGVIFKVDIDALTIERFGAGIGPTIHNDGASCAFRPGFTKSVDAREHLPDQRVTYTFEIGNPTVATFAGFSLDDTLSYDGRWVADSLAVDPSCTGTFTGSTTALGGTPTLSNNNQTLQISNMTLPPASSFCLSMQAQIDFDAVAGSVENQAVLTGLPGVFGGSLRSDDPDSIEERDPTTHEILPGVRVGDFVFVDQDSDGLFDAEDEPLGGVVVNLRDGAGVLLESTVTGADGAYIFDPVRPGSYVIEVTGPEHFTLIDGTGEDSQTSPYAFVVSDGDIEDADFAFAPFGSIGDVVFEDLDLDGVRDADEPGIEGVVVDLFDATGTLYDSVTTAGDGSYAFIDVAAGTYTVEVITPTGFSATNAGPDANADDQARTSPYTTTAADGVANTLADFGFVAFTSVGDFVFIDTDGDGLLDANEDGQSGVQVTLYENSDGNAVLDAGESRGSMVTDSLGQYLFNAVEPGAYCVELAAPEAFRATQGDDAQASPYCFTVMLGVAETDADFGLFPLAANIAADKAVMGDPVSATSGQLGHYDITYVVTVLNTGNVGLDTLSVRDDLASQFGSSFVGVVQAPTIGGPGAFSGDGSWGLAPAWSNGAPAGNLDYSGFSPNDELLGGANAGIAANDALGAGEGIEIRFTIEVDPDGAVASNRLPLMNQAEASGLPVEGPSVRVSALSDSGLNPLNNDEGEAFEAAGSPSDPTAALISRIELTQALAPTQAIAVNSSNPDWRDVQLTFNIDNNGSVPLTNISILNDLEAVMGTGVVQTGAGAQTGIVSGVLCSGPGSSALRLNADWTGTASEPDLVDQALANENVLMPGDRCEFTARVTLDLTMIDTDLANALTARASGWSDADGDGVADRQDSAPFDAAIATQGGLRGAPDTQDDSDSGFDPDTINPEALDHASGLNEGPDADGSDLNDDPTTLNLSAMGLAKDVQMVFADASSGTIGNIDVGFIFAVVNSGNTALSDLHLYEHFAANFDAAFVSVVTEQRSSTANAYRVEIGPAGQWTGQSAWATAGPDAFVTAVVAGNSTFTGRAALGVPETDLLQGGSSFITEATVLEPGEGFEVRVVAEIDPDRATAPSIYPFMNQGRLVATDARDDVLETRSDNGIDPTSSNDTENEGETQGSRSDPTPLFVSEIALTKDFVGSTANAASGAWVDVTFEFAVANIGAAPLLGLSITDAVEAQLGAGSVVLPSTQGSRTGQIAQAVECRGEGAGGRVGSFALNLTFAGTNAASELIDQTQPSFLPIGEVCRFRTVVTVNPALIAANPARNSALAQAYPDSDGDGVPDYDESAQARFDAAASTAQGNAPSDPVADLSDAGRDPKTINAGHSDHASAAAVDGPDRDSQTLNDDPTSLLFGHLALSKAVTQIVPQTDSDTMAVTFTFVALNNGTEGVEQLVLEDGLAGQLGGAFLQTLSTPQILPLGSNGTAQTFSGLTYATPAWVGTGIPGNSDYSGVGTGDSLDLLGLPGGRVLAAGEGFVVELVALIDPDGASDLFYMPLLENQGTLYGRELTQGLVMGDTSEQGLDPTVDNPSAFDPDTMADTPTMISLPQVTLTKTATSLIDVGPDADSPNDATRRTVLVGFSYVLENTGSTALTTVSLSDAFLNMNRTPNLSGDVLQSLVSGPTTTSYVHSGVGGSVDDFDASNSGFLVDGSAITLGAATPGASTPGAGQLAVGERITVSVEARFVMDLTAYGNLPTGEQILNQATVTAYADADGDGIEDYRDPNPLNAQAGDAANASADPGPDATDLSDGDSAPAEDQNGTGGATKGNPTPVALADIELTKSVIGYSQRDHIADVRFLITAENTGEVPLTRLQIFEDLETAFGDAFDASREPASVALGSFTTADGTTLMGSAAAEAAGLSANLSRFSGDAATGLGGTWLIDATAASWADALLPAGAIIRFVVTVPLDTFSQPDFAGVNQVLGQAIDPKAPTGFPPVQGQSRSPFDVGPMGTETPTTVPGIAALKSLERVEQNQSDPRLLDVTYRLVAVNTGSSPLANVNVQEAFADQFGDAFVSAAQGGVDVGARIDVLSTLPASELPAIFAGMALQTGAAASTDFDGRTAIDLLQAGFSLPVGRFVAVEVTASVDPSAAPTDALGEPVPLVNLGAAYGFLDANGDQTADQVDTNSDGVIDGPVEVRDDASDSITGDPNQPTDPSLPTPLLRPSIGVAKTIVNLDIDTQAQTLTQVFNLVIENFGDLPVYNLGLSDDQVALLALDPAAVGLQVTGATSGDRLSGGGFVVVAPASADCGAATWTFQAGFDGGEQQANVLASTGGQGTATAGNCLAPGDRVTLAYSLTYDFSTVANLSAVRFGNKVVASAAYDANGDGVLDGSRVRDESTTGTDPDGGDDGTGAGDVDPLTEDNGRASRASDGVPDEDDPTLATLPVLGLTKQLVATAPAADRDFMTLTWKFDLINQGNVPVYNLSLIDDLACNFGDAFVASEVPDIQLGDYVPGGLGSGGIGVNSGYRGGSQSLGCGASPSVDQAGSAADVLSGSGVLQVGDRLQVLMTATFDPLHPDFAADNTALSVYQHRLAAYDPSDPATAIILSDQGAEPQTGNRNGGTPTGALVLTKHLTQVEPTAANNAPAQALDARYRLRVENTGASALANLQLVDEVALGFGDGFLAAALNPALVLPPSAVGSFVSLNTAYTGQAGAGGALLQRGGQGFATAPVSSLLMPGDAFELEIIVTFDPDLVLRDLFQTDPSGRISVVTNTASVSGAVDLDGLSATAPETVDHDANAGTALQVVAVSDISDDANPADLDGDGIMDDDFDQNGAILDDPVATPIPDLTVVKGQRGVATPFTGTTPSGVDCSAATDEGFCYQLVFVVSLTNTGSANLTNPQLVDDLQAQFTTSGLAPTPAGEADAFLGASVSDLVFTNAATAGADLSVSPVLNPNFDGFSAGSTADLASSGDPNLFSTLVSTASNTGALGLLEPGDRVDVDVTVFVDPFIVDITAPDGTSAALGNSAFGYAYSDSDRDGSPDVADRNDGTEAPGDNPNPAMDQPTVQDQSDNDGDLDGQGDPSDDAPGDSDGDGDPTNDDPTPFGFPGLKVVKALTAIQGVVNSQSYEYVYTVRVTNTGTLDLSDLQISDNLTSAFGRAFIQILQAPTLIDADSSLGADSSLAANWLNPLFDGGDAQAPPSPVYGDDMLITPNTVELAAGDFLTLTYSVEIDIDANHVATRFAVPFDPLTHVGGFTNTAVASALPTDGAQASARIIDRSDDDAGKDGRSDGDNDGNADNDDDPTPAPGLLTEKSLVSPAVPSSANAVVQLAQTGSRAASRLTSSAEPGTALENVFVARFQFDWINTGSMPLLNLDLDDQLADHPGIVNVRGAAFVDAPITGRVADARCTSRSALWTALPNAGLNAFDGNAATAAFAMTGNALGLCEQVTFEIDVEFEIDPEAEGRWTNSALTTFSVDLNNDGTPDVGLQDYSDGDGNPLLDSDPSGAGSLADAGDDPTTLPLARLGLAKAFLPNPIPVPNMAGVFDHTIQLTVQNTGEVPLTGLRLVDDDFWNEWYDIAAENPGILAPYRGAAVVGNPVVVRQSDPANASISAALNTDMSGSDTRGQTVKPSWVGQSAETADPRVTVLDGAQLAVGESFALQFVVRFNPFAFELPLARYLGNQAQAIAEEADPDTLSQARYAGIYTFDQSDSGFDPTTDNPAAPRIEGEPNTFANASPLPDPALPTLRLTKQSVSRGVEVGEYATWRITVENLSAIPAIDVDIIDVLPAGFVPIAATYQIDNSAASTGTTPTLNLLDNGAYPVPDGLGAVTIDGVTVSNQGPVLQFNNLDLNPGDAVTLSFQTDTTIALDVGTYVNQAYAIDSRGVGQGQLVSSAVAEAAILVQPSSVFDCATIIGQVFRDRDGDGYQELPDGGIPAVRLSALVSGTTLEIRTDEHGRFHVPCAAIPDQDIGTNVLLKLDTETLPAGYRLTTENPRVTRATRGKVSKANFGASLDRIVTLDLNHCAFIGSSSRLNKQARAGLWALIGKLKEGRSTLRISYRAHSEPSGAIDARMRKLDYLVAQLWDRVDGGYPLNIEVETIRIVGMPAKSCHPY